MKKVIAALFIALALASASAFAEPQPRIISVTGRGSIAYKPDFVDLEFGIVTKDPSYSAAQTKNLQLVQATLSSLTTSYNVKPEDLTTLDYRLAEEPIYVDGRQTSTDYASSTRMRVRVRNLGAYRAIIVALLDAGVNGIDSISFGVDDYAPLREKALVAAYANAERTATAIATAAHTSLGKIIQVREAGSEPVAPMLRKAAFDSMAVGNGEVISSGTQLVEASVYVEYELR